jgi:hypothetical protein
MSFFSRGGENGYDCLSCHYFGVHFICRIEPGYRPGAPLRMEITFLDGKSCAFTI